MTDDILYRRYLGGDEDSLSALMERHGDKLTLYLDGGFRAYLYRSARRPTASAPRCGNTTGRAAGLGSC